MLISHLLYAFIEILQKHHIYTRAMDRIFFEPVSFSFELISMAHLYGSIVAICSHSYNVYCAYRVTRVRLDLSFHIIVTKAG